MPRSSYNDQALRRLEGAVASFLAGETGVEEIQWSLKSASALLEQSDRGTHDALRRLDADIEMVRFTLPVEQQREAVSAHVRLLLDKLAAQQQS